MAHIRNDGTTVSLRMNVRVVYLSPKLNLEGRGNFNFSYLFSY